MAHGEVPGTIVQFENDIFPLNSASQQLQVSLPWRRYWALE